MAGALLIRGMLAGLLAGLLAFGFARIVGEPAVERAIAFETGLHAQAGHDQDEPEIFSRSTQSGIGLFTGVVVYGSAFGGLFALVFALVHGRLGDLSPRATSFLLAIMAFLTLVIVPTLKYPANPPAVGDADTITLRTRLFFLTIFAGIVAMLAATALARKLVRRLGGWNAVIAGGVLFVVLVSLVQFFLPAIDEVPQSFPATLLWRFRIASLGTEVVLWTVIGLAFGALAERTLTQRRWP